MEARNSICESTPIHRNPYQKRRCDPIVTSLDAAKKDKRIEVHFLMTICFATHIKVTANVAISKTKIDLISLYLVRKKPTLCKYVTLYVNDSKLLLNIKYKLNVLYLTLIKKYIECTRIFFMYILLLTAKSYFINSKYVWECLILFWYLSFYKIDVQIVYKN